MSVSGGEPGVPAPGWQAVALSPAPRATEVAQALWVLVRIWGFPGGFSSLGADVW